MKCLEKVIIPRGTGGIGAAVQKLANERAKVFLQIPVKEVLIKTLNLKSSQNRF